MSLMKKTAITLACATALSALSAAPGLAGVITPTDKTSVSTGSPIDSVYYGWCGHHRHHYYWRGYHAAWRSPYFGWGSAYYPYATGAWSGWGPGWGGYGWNTGWGGGGLLSAGLFGIL